MKKISLGVLILVITTISLFLRFYKLETIPAGFHADGASQGYNAFSLLQTGKDRYEQSYPILFRAFGYYQPPLYTYLTIIPVAILGNTVFAARSLSAFSGLILVLITYLFLLIIFNRQPQRIFIALIGALTLSLAPWAVFFSRLTIEANLGLTIFVTSIVLFLLSLRKKYLFLLACLLLGLSTHAYYSERLISVIFLPIFIILFRDKFRQNIKFIILGLIIFFITQVPHLLVLQSGALTNRFFQVGYLQSSSLWSLISTFLNNYLIYFSPFNLFFDSDTNLGRTMPGLSVFYGWMLIPLLFGLQFCLKNRSSDGLKIILVLLIITPIPAGLTGDFFYPLRTLGFLWVLTLIISLGIYKIYDLINSKRRALLLSVLIICYSFFSLYVSYFVLFKYEKSINYGYPYIALMDVLKKYQDKHIVIDSARDPGIGVRLAYFKEHDPKRIQQQLKSQMKTNYYSAIFEGYDRYVIDNLEIKPINWGDDCIENLIMIGDDQAIGGREAELHKLTLEFEVKDLSGKVALRGYSTNPKEKCQ